jgi:hypothetical protein
MIIFGLAVFLAELFRVDSLALPHPTTDTSSYCNLELVSPLPRHFHIHACGTFEGRKIPAPREVVPVLYWTPGCL